MYSFAGCKSLAAQYTMFWLKANKFGHDFGFGFRFYTVNSNEIVEKKTVVYPA